MKAININIMFFVSKKNINIMFLLNYFFLYIIKYMLWILFSYVHENKFLYANLRKSIN